MSRSNREENKKERRIPSCEKVHSKKERRIPSCEKVHSTEKTKLRKSLLKLKQQEYLMEKNLANLMENMKLEPEVLQSILHNANDITKNRQVFLDNMKRSLEEISMELKLAKNVIEFPENIQKLDTSAFKERLVRLSQRIHSFKESCQLQTLSQEQIALESELREFELNLHKYENATSSIGKSTTAAFANKENKRCHDYKNIQDFHALIAKTGHTDNWSDDDHLLFLKTRKKCNSIPAMVAAIQIKCPDLTAENIVNHEAWYKIYLSLREKQRLTIREWRKQKETEKMMKNQQNETTTETLEETSSHLQRKKINFNVTEESSIRVTDNCEKITKTATDVNNAKKELIKQWKAEREKKRLMDEEQLKILTESKLAAQEKRKRENLKRIQEALVEYRERKLTEVSLETSKMKPKYNPMLIEAFRKQDEEYTKRKKNLIAELRRPVKNRTVKIVRPQMAGKRDYSTLLNSTKVWKEKCRMQDPDSKELRKLQYIKDVPRLYVQWRNKESTEIKDILAFS